jgi:hypothetical protein
MIITKRFEQIQGKGCWGAGDYLSNDNGKTLSQIGEWFDELSSFPETWEKYTFWRMID